MPLSAVLFDYGHTLVDFRRTEEALRDAYEQIRARIEAAGYLEMPEILDLIERVVSGVDQVVAASYEARRMEELEILEVFGESLEAVGFTLPRDVVEHVVAIYHSAFSNSLEVQPETVGAIEAIAADGYRLGLVSNVTLQPHLMRRDLDDLGLGRFFAATTFSSEVGWRKPDPRIFRRVLDELEVTPALDDVSGARSVGMRTVLTHEFRRETEGDDEPDAVIARLGDLPPLLAAWRAATA